MQQPLWGLRTILGGQPKQAHGGTLYHFFLAKVAE